MKRIYAIGDLHFSGGQNKPMDIFGTHWGDHKQRIISNWKQLIKENDLVLIPGDISWAMYLDDAKADLNLIHQLPGEKILLKGNHDYWWKKITHLNSLYANMKFLQNNSFCYENFCVCGSRGWLVPGNVNYSESDEKIYKREAVRLNLSLQNASKDKPIIVMMHYPPFNESYEENEFIKIINKYNVKVVVYGHLHDEYSFRKYFQGVANGVEYKLVSSDYLNFKPVEVKL